MTPGLNAKAIFQNLPSQVNQAAAANAAALAVQIKPLVGTTLHELRKGNFAEPDAIFAKLLYPGLTVFGGRPKIGKSWLTLQLANSAASGADFLGLYAPHRALTVLYLALEEPKWRTVSRARKIGISTDERVDGNITFVYRDEVLPMLNGGLAQLEKTIADAKPDLIIVDSLMAWRGGVKKNKNSIVDEDYQEMKALHDFAEQHGLCVVLIHHTRKAAAEYGPDALIGTSGTSAAVDAIWTLQPPKKSRGRKDDKEPDEDEGLQHFEVTGRDGEPIELALRLVGTDNTVRWNCEGAGLAAKVLLTTAERRQVFRLVQKAEKITVGEMAGILGKSEESVRYLLLKMIEDGFIRNITKPPAEGIYEIAPDAKEPCDLKPEPPPAPPQNPLF